MTVKTKRNFHTKGHPIIEKSRGGHRPCESCFHKVILSNLLKIGKYNKKSGKKRENYKPNRNFHMSVLILHPLRGTRLSVATLVISLTTLEELLFLLTSNLKVRLTRMHCIYKTSITSIRGLLIFIDNNNNDLN